MSIWRTIPGFSRYEASTEGKIRRGRRVLKGNFSSDYEKVNIANDLGVRKSVYVHNLVALAFWGERPKFNVVTHINGNKRDNRFDNLKYVKKTNLDEYKVSEIFRLKENKIPERKISNILGIPYSQVRGVLHSGNWAWVKNNIN